MRDTQAHLEKLRTETDEFEMIAKLAAEKHELFTKLAQHYKVLASEVERAINKKEAVKPRGCGALCDPCPVRNNRIDEDTEPELPDDFVAEKRMSPKAATELPTPFLVARSSTRFAIQ